MSNLERVWVTAAVAAARIANVVGDIYGRSYWIKEVGRRFALRHGRRL